MKKILKIFLLMSYFIFCLNIVHANTSESGERLFLTGAASFSKIKTSYLDFKQCDKKDINVSDKLFYAYIKELQSQVDLMNEYNVLNVRGLGGYPEMKQTDVDFLMSKFCLKIVSTEVSNEFIIDYEKIYDNNKDLLSPQMLIWLEYLKNNTPLLVDGGLNVKIDKVRENIVNLENIVVNYPNFVARKDVIEALNKNVEVYYCIDFDNTAKFNRQTSILSEEYKNSYDKFLEENKNSKYYKDFFKYYNRLKANNFKEINSPKFKFQYKKSNSNLKKILERNDVCYQIQKIESMALDKAVEYINYAYFDYNYRFEGSKIDGVNSIYDATLHDRKMISNRFEMYSKNKNNMLFNFELYKDIKGYINQYKEILSNFDEIYKQAAIRYMTYIVTEFKNVKISAYSSYDEQRYYDSYKFSLEKFTFEDFNNMIQQSLLDSKLRVDVSQINDTISYFEELASEIYNYSYDYEKNRTQKFMNTNGRKNDGGDIAAFVYVASYSNPNPNSIYHYSSASHPLFIMQVLNNGVLVKGANSVINSGYCSTASPIFIQTTKKYVSNQALRQNTYYVYVGNKTYSTIWGTRTVRQFREIDKAQVINNFKTREKLYFYTNF